MTQFAKAQSYIQTEDFKIVKHILGVQKIHKENQKIKFKK